MHHDHKAFGENEDNLVKKKWSAKYPKTISNEQMHESSCTMCKYIQPMSQMTKRMTGMKEGRNGMEWNGMEWNGMEWNE